MAAKRKRSRANKAQQKKNAEPEQTTASGVTSRPMIFRLKAQQQQGDEALQGNDQYFRELIELVPADLYYPKEDVDDDSWKMRKYRKNAKGDAPKQKVKENSRKGKKKRTKFGTTEFLSVQQVGEKRKEEEEKKKQEQDAAEAQDMPAKPSKPAATLDELQERMRNRVNEFKAKRTKDPNKKRRGADKSVQQSKKQKLDEKREASSKDKSDAAPQDGELDQIHNKLASSLSSKISYGNLDISGDGKELFNGVEKKQVEKQKTKTILDVKKLIKQAESNQEKIEAIKGDDRINEDDQLFETMEKKALGMKVKDNPKLLKKTLKRLEQKKKKSTKAWNQRVETTKKQQTERLDKRDENVANKKQKKLETRLKKKGIEVPKEKKKSKRQRPGFEGKSGFVNDAKKGDKKSTPKKK